MTTSSLATAVALSDQELLTRIDALAGKEREASVELVAHLAALELRPSVQAAQGYGSLFAYCTHALRLSEDAACNRIDAARVCLRFPMVLDLLATGSISLATVRVLKPHLTAENHEAVFARARHRTRKEVEALVAELAPRPDVPASVRKLPAPMASAAGIVALPRALDATLAEAAALPFLEPGSSVVETVAPSPVATDPPTGCAETSDPSRPATSPGSSSATCGARRPIVQALAPQRYRVQFTIGQESHDRLQRLQSLLRREIPNGDAGAIFERALELLHDQVEKVKLGVGARARRAQVIRPGADKDAGSRHVPSTVRCAVWRRDAGQCAFVSSGGHRCTERNFLELHHIQPYAMDGPATVGNISLRCRRHNQYEAELVFGSHAAWPQRAP